MGSVGFVGRLIRLDDEPKHLYGCLRRDRSSQHQNRDNATPASTGVADNLNNVRLFYYSQTADRRFGDRHIVIRELSMDRNNRLDPDHVLIADFLAAMGRLDRDPVYAHRLFERWGQAEDFRTTEFNGVCWGAIAVRFPRGKVFVFMHGVWGPLSSYRLSRGYFYSVVTARRSYEGFNREVYRTAIDILNYLVEPIRRPGDIFRLCGHSAGGGVAECLAVLITGRVELNVAEIITFGAPKVALPDAIPFNLRTSRSRYIVAGDPVPAVPAMLQNGIVFSTLHGGGPHDMVNHVCHGSGGMNASLPNLPSQHEAVLSGPAAGKINRWVRRQEPETTLHGMDTYANALRSVLTVQSQDARPGIAEPLPNAFELLEEIRITDLVESIRPGGITRRNAAEIARDQQGSPAAPPPEQHFVLPLDMLQQPNVVLPIDWIVIDGPMVIMPDGSRRPARYVRVPGMAQSTVGSSLRWSFQRSATRRWNVFFMGHLVARCESSSAAKTICRTGNRMLRQMGNRTAWDPQELVSAWTDFITAAASGGSSYNPPLRLIL